MNMKNLYNINMRFLQFLAILFLTINISFAKTHNANDLFEIDIEDSFTPAKSNDPAVVLRLENGKNFIEFAKLEDELSDFYLKSRIKEQAETIKQKGENVSDIKNASIHSISTAYYITYKENIVCLLTYNGISYNVIASGIPESKFKEIIYFFRKPQEKVEPPKPAPAPKKIAKKHIEIEKSSTTIETPIISSTDVLISSTNIETATNAITETQVSTSTFIKEENMEELKKNAFSFISKLSEKSSESKMLIKRKPLNKNITAGLLIVWLILVFTFNSKYSKIPNPKITPYPQDVPPDFFFPFIITRVRTAKETFYHIITRQKQILSGYYNHSYQPLLSVAIYGLLTMHLLWSLSEYISENLFINLISSLPLGGYIAAIPELPFILLLIYGLIKKSKTTQRLDIEDNQRNIIVSVLKDKKFYAALKDGKGKEVAYLRFNGNKFKRMWQFIDTDNQIVFNICDDHPQIYKAIKLFGNPFRNLRCRYSIFVDNKRAGFLYIDFNSKDSFQVHLEYGFARLAHPAHIMASLLYISAIEKESSFINL